MELIAQIIGLLAVATFLLSYQQKKRKNIILLNTISRCLYITQYLLLGAFSGAVLDILGAISSVIAGKKHSKFIKNHTKTVLICINICILISGCIIAYINKSFIDLLPIAGILLHTSAFWINNEKIIRRVSLLGSPFWFIYNFLSRAYGSALGDILTMCSIVIAMIRHKDSKKQ
ncbi:MAG: YgjV family protein [Ruminococcaceae bacterium]|nr:YgjV family protein [Oscillospiraceae bacterium]